MATKVEQQQIFLLLFIVICWKPLLDTKKHQTSLCPRIPYTHVVFVFYLLIFVILGIFFIVILQLNLISMIVSKASFLI